jgi:ribosomal protein L11 methyltransferase
MSRADGDTIELRISIHPWTEEGAEILQAFLHDLKPIGTLEFKGGVSAFFHRQEYHEGIQKTIMDRWPQDIGTLTYGCLMHPGKNWNEAWEHHFRPVLVHPECRIRAPFHEADRSIAYDLVIQPRMAFGTGHHETTKLMIRAMMRMDLRGKTILDMGCGTGILSILAAKMGAGGITAMDVDPMAIENSAGNQALNGCKNIQLVTGNASSIPSQKYHLILANIHLVVLLEDLGHYAMALTGGGTMLISGFRPQDAKMIEPEALTKNLVEVCRETLGEWMLLGYKTVEKGPDK